MAVVIRARSYEIPIHGPVVVLAEGEAVSGVVVLALGKRDKVSGVDERDIIASGEIDAESAGGALLVVDGENLAVECGATAIIEFFLGDEEFWLVNVDW